MHAMADAMEKARLKEEAKPVSAAIFRPRQQARREGRQAGCGPQGEEARKPEHFTAVAPGKPGDHKEHEEAD